ncbi:MAG: GNAT family N-acetyltransferase [Spirochaetales bacterium]|nr:GNAT family N-acetyltransferase [Spirochaetales bacterium]
METVKISGDRITLQLLSKEDLELWIKDQAELSGKLGLGIDADPLDDDLRRVFMTKIDNMERDPGSEVYYSYFAIVLKNTIIGTIGSKGMPNINESIEVGYGIAGSCSNKGYTTEALRLFCDYFFQNHDIESVIAESHKRNIPSQKVLTKNGFEVIDEGEYQLWELVNPGV